MAYNRENILQRIADIQSIVKENGKSKNGRTQKWIYENLIRDQYRISYDCFNKYIAYPSVKTELGKLQKKKQKEKELKELQLKLF